MTRSRREDQGRLGDKVFQWWTELVDPGNPTSRRQRAELRRANTLAEVALTPAYVDLLDRIGEVGGGRPFEQVAAIASVLGEVRREAGARHGDFARTMARTVDRRPAVSELRFRRLLATDEREQLAAQLRRVVPMLDAPVPIPDLALSVYYWGDARKRQWAEQYWAPPADDSKGTEPNKEAS